MFRFVPPLLAMILLAAHFARHSQPGLMWLSIITPLLLFLRYRWIPRVYQGLLLIGAGIWGSTAISLVQARLSQGQGWFRALLILGSVALLTAAASLVFQKSTWCERFYSRGATPWLSTFTFFGTAIGLSVIQLKVQPPMLLLERFWPGAGWLEILALALYAGWIVEKLSVPAQTARWRGRIWLGFSIVFFTQLILGLAGLEQFLMSGALHLPIPALILAGPIYRGAGFFMPVLFLVTIVLVGPAWCSHLCYIGAWDHQAAQVPTKPRLLPHNRHLMRRLILFLVIGVALGLRILNLATSMATGLAVAFGLGGIAVMWFGSRRQGVMTHCVVYCPIGLLANWLGRLSPFRIRLDAACTECGACARVCRYDALQPHDIKQRRPNLSCTLCGDCLHACHGQWIHYHFFKMKPATTRLFFLGLIVVLHSLFLGLARI